MKPRRPKPARKPEVCWIIDAFGGTGRVAALCGVSGPSVSGWKRYGIPNGYRQFLELHSPHIFERLARLKLKCPELFAILAADAKAAA